MTERERVQGGQTPKVERVERESAATTGDLQGQYKTLLSSCEIEWLADAGETDLISLDGEPNECPSSCEVIRHS